MLSDEDLALVLEGKAKKLESGKKNRQEVTKELAEIVADDLVERDADFVTRGPLRSQGRASFGRANEGRSGVALFIPDE
jgi:hypothetical protein